MTTVDPDLSSMFTAGSEKEPLIPGDVEDSSIFSEGDVQEKETAPLFEEKTPTVPPKDRKPLAKLFALAWGGIGQILERTQIDYPVGRVMQFQAPIAGEKFEELVMHTWLDALLQPLAQTADRAEGFGVVIGLPVLMALWERNPAASPVFESLMAEAVEASLYEMVPIMKEKNRKKRAAARVLSDLDELGIPKGVDPVQFVLQQLTAPPVDVTATEEP